MTVGQVLATQRSDTLNSPLTLASFVKKTVARESLREPRFQGQQTRFS